MNRPIEISVVISTHNRARFLPACVESVLRQTAPGAAFEVLIVENACTDDTGAVARSLQASDPRVRHVIEPVKGLSQARNRGWKEARGRWVAFLDDDATADPRWMASALSAFREQPDAAWVGGPIALDGEAPLPAWLGPESWHYFGHVDWGDAACVLEPGRYLGGGNSFFPRAVLARLGGFDPRLGRQGRLLIAGEETHLEWRLRHADATLYYHPGVRIRHHVSADRMRRTWLYRHAFWDGVTGVALQTLLRSEIGPAFNIHVDSPTPAPGSRWTRLARNAGAACGLSGDLKRTFTARCYLWYVLGSLFGLLMRSRFLRTARAEFETGTGS